MKLSDLAKETDGILVGGEAEIRSLCIDSRVAGEGDLFFCYKGTACDSHDYAAEAEARGAEAVVCERELGLSIPMLVTKDGRDAMARIAAAFYGHPERKLKLIGITGTNGKTTTAHMLYSVLCAAGKRAGLIGTLGARYGNTFLPPSLTTPDPLALFSLLADMAEAKTEYVVMEVSAHALALEKTGPILFELAVFTNLTQDHLDFFGDMQTYGAAKKKLFCPARCREAILNSDDAFSRELTGKVPETTYGLETPADCFALVESEQLGGFRLLLNLEDELVETELPMTGRHNIYNALAAATAAKKLGATPDDIARGLSATAVEGRLERVGSHAGGDIFVDFAHTPDGLEKSLAALRPHCLKRLIVLFGCGGNRDRGKRSEMGRIAAERADFCVITSDNPRYEDPAAIMAEIAVGFDGVSDDFVEIEEREEATKYAIGMLEKGDVLLIAGKGGEHEQEIMGIKYAYNDKDVVRSVLEKL